MPQLSRMMVMFCACFSHAAFPPLWADIDRCDTAKAITLAAATSISFFMERSGMKTCRIVPQNPRVSISIMRSRVRVSALIVCVAALAATLSAQRAAPRFDVIIRNGRIVDGTGAPWFRGDVGLAGDRIAAIGNLSGAMAATTID